MRLAIRGGTALVWPDQDAPIELPVTAVTGGQPGIGAYSTPPGNALTSVQLGAITRTPPLALTAGTLRVAASPKEVTLQWTAVAADANSPGLAGYWIYRDGAYFGRTQDTTFSDETVAAGSAYTYLVYAVDQHYNFSPAASATVAVPASPSSGPRPPPPDLAHPLRPSASGPSLPVKGPATAGASAGSEPRRIGVRANGSYWGAAGEQIDTLSGNLNFTLPLLKPQSRGGWSDTFALTYNSQIWRQDSGGTWMLGKDVGYGLGWKLLAGAVTPIWSGTQLDHYLFTDSTGAEYRLDQNSGGVWTSQEGVYVSYDANYNRVYFPDGSFWLTGCISAGGEQDAGTYYPTTLYDTNGNTLS